MVGNLLPKGQYILRHWVWKITVILLPDQEEIVLVDFEEHGVNISYIGCKNTLDKQHTAIINKQLSMLLLSVIPLQDNSTHTFRQNRAGNVSTGNAGSSAITGLQPRSIAIWILFLGPL